MCLNFTVNSNDFIGELTKIRIWTIGSNCFISYISWTQISSFEMLPDESTYILITLR